MFVCIVAICGCGSTATPITPNQPYCLTGCGTVKGVAERCGGPAPGACSLARVETVNARGPRGQGAGAQAAAGKTIDSFSLLLPAGRYVLESTVDGQRIKRSIDVRARQTLHVNLVDQIR